MKGENPLSNKEILREALKTLRRTIGPEKRNTASQAALKQFEGLSGMVLSFASFNDEIDLWALNHYLAEKDKLVLPRIEKDRLVLYKVEQIEEQLASSNWGILEPVPSKCEEISPEVIRCALIPGLGFDRARHRIGYGKGHYDRLIPTLTLANNIGVGFTEQLLDQPIPLCPHDEGLDELELF